MDSSFAGFWRAVFLPRLRDGLDDDRGLRSHRPGAWSHRPAVEALAGGGEGVGIGGGNRPGEGSFVHVDLDSVRNPASSYSELSSLCTRVLIGL